MTQHLSIGDLAKATDTKIETIRYYERIKLLPEPARTSGNYRSYETAHLSRLGSSGARGSWDSPSSKCASS